MAKRLGAILLMFFITQYARSAKIPAEEKVLLVKVDDIGLIMVGRDTVGSDQLARYIQERLFKSYMGTGKMYDRIIFEKEDAGVPDEVTEAVIGEIKTGQNKALQELCLQKYNKTFEVLEKKKQERLRRQFPVLFQEQYSPNT